MTTAAAGKGNARPHCRWRGTNMHGAVGREIARRRLLLGRMRCA